MRTFLRDSKLQPEEGEGDGLDCECASSTDAEGKVNRIFFVRRVPKSRHDENQAEDVSR